MVVTVGKDREARVIEGAPSGVGQGPDGAVSFEELSSVTSDDRGALYVIDTKRQAVVYTLQMPPSWAAGTALEGPRDATERAPGAAAPASQGPEAVFWQYVPPTPRSPCGEKVSYSGSWSDSAGHRGEGPVINK